MTKASPSVIVRPGNLNPADVRLHTAPPEPRTSATAHPAPHFPAGPPLLWPCPLPPEATVPTPDPCRCRVGVRAAPAAINPPPARTRVLNRAQTPRAHREVLPAPAAHPACPRPAARPSCPPRMPSLLTPGPPHVRSEDRSHSAHCRLSARSSVLSREQPLSSRVLGSGEFPSRSFPTSTSTPFTRSDAGTLGVRGGRAGREAAACSGPSRVPPPPPDAGAESVGVIREPHADGVSEAVPPPPCPCFCLPCVTGSLRALPKQGPACGSRTRPPDIVWEPRGAAATGRGRKASCDPSTRPQPSAEPATLSCVLWQRSPVLRHLPGDRDLVRAALPSQLT